VRDDTIRLENAVFAEAGASGRLGSNLFHRGVAAHDASDRIIYDRSTGYLYYDPDGTGAEVQVAFAKLKAGLSLTAADFLVV
jgi:Ca2+-binding RTX toxin-like protein